MSLLPACLLAHISLFLDRSMLSQRQEDLEVIEAVTTRPAWVVDHNTYKLWEQGLDESMMPADIVFSEETAEQVKRMLAWAAARVAELDDARLRQIFVGFVMVLSFLSQ